jgi:hypothetical protein
VKAVAFVPSAPLLLIGAGPADLRVCLDEALAVLTGDVVVVGAAPRPGWWEGSVDLTPYGVRGAPAGDALPLALAVGRTLLGARPHRLWGVPADGQPDGLPEADSLLVVADGTATRSEKAPGHLDPRAEAFDHAVATALDTADGAALRALDPELASELWVGGLAAWRAAAAVPGPWHGAVTYAQAPYGVGYVVAVWTR